MSSTDVTELATQLESDGIEARLAAAEQLSYLADQARAAAVPLVRAMADDNEEVREWLTSALEDLGPPDPTDAAALAGLLADRNADVGYWAATLLGRLEQQGAEAVARLAAAVRSHPADSVRERAAWALGKMGAAAAPAKQDLEQASASQNERLARLARKALQSLG